MSGQVSVVIPALNAEAGLGAAIESVSVDLTTEIIVCDGGSTDGSTVVARAAGARVITSERGRGAQLAAGAAAAGGDWLLFLHADTVLSRSWEAEAGNFMAIPSNRRRAGAFQLCLDSSEHQARRVERLANWRSRTFGMAYGDQGLLISRAFYDEIGGFEPIPLMEDVSIMRRIGRKRLHMFDAQATTDAVRCERDGWFLRPARNITLLVLYFLGLSPRLLARLYG